MLIALLFMVLPYVMFWSWSNIRHYHNNCLKLCFQQSELDDLIFLQILCLVGSVLVVAGVCACVCVCVCMCVCVFACVCMCVVISLQSHLKFSKTIESIPLCIFMIAYVDCACKKGRKEGKENCSLK